MSLAIIVTTNEGNVLAADSMETYRNAIGDIRMGSENRMKLFQLNRKVGALACGISFLENKNIQQHIHNFKTQYDLESMEVTEVVDKLYDFFADIYSKFLTNCAEGHKKRFEEKGCKDVKYTFNLECINLEYKDEHGKKQEQKLYQSILEFLVCGHDSHGVNHVYKITLPDPKEKNGVVLKLNKEQSGATWIGQTDVLIRIIRGWSPEIKRLPIIQDLPPNKKDELLRQIDDQEYVVNWGTMTLQDAIEFSELAVKITESIQKITDGTWSLPGSSPGVGGPIDVAVVTPEKGFHWIQKKKLHINDSIVDLDETESKVHHRR